MVWLCERDVYSPCYNKEKIVINADFEFFIYKIKFRLSFADFSDSGVFVVSFSSVVVSIKDMLSDVILHLDSR